MMAELSFYGFKSVITVKYHSINFSTALTILLFVFTTFIMLTSLIKLYKYFVQALKIILASIAKLMQNLKNKIEIS